MNQKTLRHLALIPAAVAAGAANATAVDVTAIVTDIGAQMASITAVAGAVLLIFVGVKAFKWVRKALS